MRAFLQSLDEKVWLVMGIGWTMPKEAPADQGDVKIKATNFNSRALNSLFSAVTNVEFKKISFTEIAKKAWTILQTTYEGTKAVKDSKFQRLTTSFEEIKMEKNESFNEFYAKVKDIVNLVFNLGKTIPKPKIVRKVLRSLPERFYAKITSIEELQDIDKIPLIELVDNLQTYELGLTRIGKSSKCKSMALKAKSSDIDESSDDEDSKMKSYIIYVLELDIELIEQLILLHLNLFKACSEPLKFQILDSLSSFIGCLEDGPCFLYSFSGGYFLEFLISDCTEQSIQCLAVKVCRLDLGFILVGRHFLWLGLAYLNSLPHLLIQRLQESSHAYFLVCIVSTIK